MAFGILAIRSEFRYHLPEESFHCRYSRDMKPKKPWRTEYKGSQYPAKTTRFYRHQSQTLQFSNNTSSFCHISSSKSQHAADYDHRSQRGHSGYVESSSSNTCCLCYTNKIFTVLGYDALLPPQFLQSEIPIVSTYRIAYEHQTVTLTLILACLRYPDYPLWPQTGCRDYRTT